MTKTSARDVAAFVCAEMLPERLSRMKLLKLVYYSQVWSLVWDREPLFFEVVKAWDDGPVVPDLWQASKRGELGDSARLSEMQKASIREVLSFYGKFSGDELSQLSHREAPWRDARDKAPPGERSPAISHQSMADFYSRVVNPDERRIPEGLRRGLLVLLDAAEDEARLLTEESDEPLMSLEEFEQQAALGGVPGAQG